jgi:hypothetical protein
MTYVFRKLGFAALAACIAVSTAAAQGGIRGRVTDEAGAPVPDVRLILAPGDQRTLSDDDGNFAFLQLKPGSYSLDVRRIGYQPQVVKLDVGPRGMSPAAIKVVAIPRVLDSVRIAEKANGLRYTGVVLDERSAPMADAIVMVPGKARELRTDANGRFSVEGFGAGTVIARVRKLGYVPQMHSLDLDRSLVDSIRMKRLAQNLSAVQVTTQSGFGKDTFAYRDLDERMRWKNEKSYIVSREEFAEQGTATLADAIRYSVTGGKYGGTLAHPMPDGCIIINGERALRDWPLTAFHADEVETVEVYPPKSDATGTLEVRGCDPKKPVYVIWMMGNSTRFPPIPPSP